jgi:DNA-binding transcriptional ArsR family regulator
MPSRSPPRRTESRSRAAASARAARVLAALGDETRLALVGSLCAGGAVSIAGLTAGTQISRQGVTKHLRVLADAGLASDIRDGREHLWQFEPRALAAALKSLGLLEQQWRKAILRTSVER